MVIIAIVPGMFMFSIKRLISAYLISSKNTAVTSEVQVNLLSTYPYSCIKRWYNICRLYGVSNPEIQAMALYFGFILIITPIIMWKTILPGEKVTQGDSIRYQPSSSNLSYRDKVYQVVKTEQHYFEIVIKPDIEDTGEDADRKIIKYMDIGYHLGLEVLIDH